MAKITVLTLAVSCGCLATYYSSENPNLYSYVRSSLLGLLILFPALLIYKVFIYPFYTSPLRGLPQVPRHSGWRNFFNILLPEAVLEAVDTVPNNGLLRHVDMLNKELIIVTKPSGVAEVLQTRADDFTKTPQMKRVLVDILGNGLITAEGLEHKIQRKALTPAFSFRTIKELYPLFWKKASQMVSLINDDLKANATAGKASTVDIEDWTSRISLDIIGEAGFGSTFDSLTHPFTPLNNSYRAAFVVDASSRSLFVLSMLTSPALTNLLPIKKVRDKLAGVKEVTAWVKSLIEVRKANMHMNASDENYSEKMGHKDIISTVMKGGSLSTEGLVEQSKTLLGAGHETSATGLTWAIHVLAQPENAHVQKRLREEIRSKLPSPDSGVELHSEMVDNLPYLDAVSKEMLRVYPPVPTIGRISVRDTVICGTKIPKGTLVRAFPWAINKTKHLWGEDAREFNPERWLVGKDKATGGSGEALSTITFGHGPSGCIGKGFAQAENKIILAALIGSFEFKQAGGKHVDPNITFAVTAKIVGMTVETTALGGW